MKLLLAAVLTLICSRCIAQNDTAGAPFKIFFSGSLIATLGWKPQEGKFYPFEWYDDSKPTTYSGGYGYGLMAGIKIFHHQYLITGAEVIHAKFDKFRVTPAPDERHGPAVSDSFFISYSKDAIRFPLGVQFPFFFKRITIAGRLGAAGELTTSESYEEIILDNSNGDLNKFSRPFDSKVTRFTGIRIETGVDVEFRNIIGNTLLYLGINFTSPNIGDQHLEEYFLKYGSAISFRLGIGYFFARKEKPREEYTLLSFH